MANDGVLSLVNSNVINNYSPRGGGGLHNDFGATLRLTNSTVSGNLAAFYGGGIRNRGNLTVTNSTVSGNSATQDGGGVISGGTLILLNSTISGNTAVQDGGGPAHLRHCDPEQQHRLGQFGQPIWWGVYTLPAPRP